MITNDTSNEQQLYKQWLTLIQAMANNDAGNG